jgi:cobalt/nickel transport protein
MKITTKLWLGILILALLSPLGLLLPECFRAGDAWGEWGADSFPEMVGYVPQGLARLADSWSAPLPDYAFGGWEEKGLSSLSLAYIFSAVLGIAITVLVMTLIGRMLSSRGD